MVFMETATDGTPLGPGERRCWACHDIWWTQTPDVVVEARTTAGPWHGALAGEETGTVIWRCSHDHARQLSWAIPCADAELERRRAADRRPPVGVGGDAVIDGRASRISERGPASRSGAMPVATAPRAIGGSAAAPAGRS